MLLLDVPAVPTTSKMFVSRFNKSAWSSPFIFVVAVPVYFNTSVAPAIVPSSTTTIVITFLYPAAKL